MNKLSLVTSAVALTLALSGCGDSSNKDDAITELSDLSPTVSMDKHLGNYLHDLTQGHILPSYQQFQATSEAMLDAATNFCALTTAGESDLQLVQEAWLANNLSWQKIQWLKVGPVVDSLFKIQYWPDTNEAVSRGIATHLADPSALTAQIITKKQVGGQGLPAAEFLLYPNDEQDNLLVSDNKEKRCELLIAISQNLTNIASDILTKWSVDGDNYANTLTTGTGEFTGKKDAVEELITNWLEQVEKVKDEKILKPLAEAAPGLPATAEHALSDQSLASIKINLASFTDIYSAAQGHGFDDILTELSEQAQIAESMQQKIAAAEQAILLLEGSYKEALNDADKRQALTDAIDKVREIRDMLTAEFVQILDLNIGFNSNDGD